MESVFYVWIGTAAGAPVILVLLSWVLVIMHSHREQWRSVDLFVVAIVAAQVVKQQLTFCFAILTLLKAEGEAACATFLWGFTATHTLQAALLVSLAVDRALTLQWPYRYRLSVRRSQVRYHLCVLAMLSGLVGVAAVFARPVGPSQLSQFLQLPSEGCAFISHGLDAKFAAFCIAMHSVMLVGAVCSAAVVQMRLWVRRNAPLSRSASDLHALSHAFSDTSTASTTTTTRGTPPGYTSSSSSTSSSASSGCPLSSVPGLSSKAVLSGNIPTGHLAKDRKSPGAQSSTKPTSLAKELRWSIVSAILCLAYFLNHLPVLVAAVLGAFFPEELGSWPVGAGVLAAGVVEGLLLPVVLLLLDSTFSSWVADTYRRRDVKSALPSGHAEPPFRMYRPEVVTVPRQQQDVSQVNMSEIKFPLTNGSLFTSLAQALDRGVPIVPNYRRGRLVGSRVPWAGRPTSMTPREIRGIFAGTPTPLWSSNSAIHGLGRISVSEPIYSDPVAALKATEVTNPMLQQLGRKYQEDDDHIYATLSDTMDSLGSLCESNTLTAELRSLSSACTVATDFEFHDVRGRESRLRGVLNTAPDTSQDAELQSSEGVCNRGFESDEEPKNPPHRFRTEITIFNLGSRKKTLSMNDLDLIESSRTDEQDLDENIDNKKDEDEEEMLFRLPVKSESMLSLYRMYLQDENGSSGDDSPRFRSSVSLGRNLHHLQQQGARRFHHHHHHHHQSHRKPFPRRYQKRASSSTCLSQVVVDKPLEKSASVVSIDSLCSALNTSSVSYLDNGDVCVHTGQVSGNNQDSAAGMEDAGSRKVFVTGFI